MMVAEDASISSMSTNNSTYATSPSAKRGGRAILLILAIFIALISFRKDILSMVFVSSPSSPTRSEAHTRSGELVSEEAFNSYKLNTPIFEAVWGGHLELVRSLLQGGYNVNAEDKMGMTPLIEATLRGNVDIVTLLLDNGARAQPTPGFRHTPLRAAALTANKQLISLLLERGADPNAQSEGGRTPLMGACFLRPQFDESPERLELSFGAVELLLADERTDARIRNDHGESALDLCRERAYDESMIVLRSRVNPKSEVKI